MAFGLQVFNDAGGFQIDGVYPQFVLRRKMNVATSYWVNGETIGYSGVAVAVGSDEIIALSSSVPCGITNRQGSDMRIVSQGNVGTVITVYVFGPITAASGGMGLQVFNGNGAIVFDSSQKPLVMVGFPTGEGNFTYNGARSYAAICVNQFSIYKNTRTGGGASETQRFQLTQGMVKAIAGGINISNIMIYDTYYYLDPGSSAVDETTTANTPNRHIIVDTTYF